MITLTGRMVMKFGPDGSTYALCPKCRTPAVRFVPLPGVTLHCLCRRRDCGHKWDLLVWPPFEAFVPCMVTGLADDDQTVL